MPANGAKKSATPAPSKTIRQGPKGAHHETRAGAEPGPTRWVVKDDEAPIGKGQPPRWPDIDTSSNLNFYTMNPEEMKEVILEYVIEEYAEDDDDVTFDTPLISGGLVDSFSMVSLKRFLEVKYKISIPDEDATPEAFDNVNSIAELVQRFL